MATICLIILKAILKSDFGTAFRNQNTQTIADRQVNRLHQFEKDNSQITTITLIGNPA